MEVRHSQARLACFGLAISLSLAPLHKPAQMSLEEAEVLLIRL